MCKQHDPNSRSKRSGPVNVPPNTDTPNSPPLLIIACFLVAIFWIIEAYLDSIFIETASFTARLLPSDPNELWMRGLVSIILIGFGGYAEKTQASILRSRTLNMETVRLFRNALSRTIRGTFPICSICKNIHVHGDIWIPPENFISAQSEAEFTTSICKRCESENPSANQRIKSEGLKPEALSVTRRHYL